MSLSTIFFTGINAFTNSVSFVETSAFVDDSHAKEEASYFSQSNAAKLQIAENTTPSYIKPTSAHHIDAPFPQSTRDDQVLGMYFNILYPQDAAIIAQQKLSEWMLQDAFSFPLSLEEFKALSVYRLTRIPSHSLKHAFANKVAELVEQSISPLDAMEQALEWLEKEASPHYRKIADALFQNQKLIDDLIEKERYQTLIDAVEKCANDPKKGVKRLQEEWKKQYAIGLDSFLTSVYTTIHETSAHALRPSDAWELRQKVLKSVVEQVRQKAPNAPFFMALQEATPLALKDIQNQLKDLDLQWISFNNITGKETDCSGKESVSGESLGFTSTIALSTALKVQRVSLGELPTMSGSLRKILGVEVLNEKT